MRRINLLRGQVTSSVASHDFFAHVPKAPLNPILGMSILFRADKDPNKIDLGVGAYKTEEGKPYVFEVVKAAEKEIHQELLTGKINKEYQGSEGSQDYLDLSQKIVFGEELYPKLKGRISSSQSLGGTGALRIAADFLIKFFPATIYVPDPTWENHHSIFKTAGLKVEEYPYWNSKTRGLDLDALLKRFEEIPNKSIILLHSCAHNPTGIDPTPDQWKQIAAVLKKKNHYPFFDNAYQGFASGDLQKDAFAIRYFAEQGFQMIVTQSYSKTIGLYGERAGAFHILSSSNTVADNLITQLRIVVRVNYSNPPLHPMRIVTKVLSSKVLYSNWLDELKIVAGRIIEMRKLLRQELEKINTPGKWDNITNQIGMFSYTGLSETQSERMINDHHVYMLKNGRISMSGVTTKNVKAIAEAIKKSIESGQ